MKTVGDGIISEIKPCKGKLPADRIRDAAPALLAALELIKDKVWQHIEMNMFDEEIAQIEAAIAAARGE